MIVYDLKCYKGHEFEGWFDDLESFENQRKKGLIACPVCDDSRIEKMPSTFGIKSAPQPPKESMEQQKLIAQFGKQVANYIEKNFEDVGSNFAKEALKIHYGASEAKNIRGSSTQEEEKMLRKEGVKFLKFPVPASPDCDDP